MITGSARSIAAIESTLFSLPPRRRDTTEGGRTAAVPTGSIIRRPPRSGERSPYSPEASRGAGADTSCGRRYNHARGSAAALAAVFVTP